MSTKVLVLSLVVGIVLFVPSCGHDQQLVSISIEPSVQTFGDSTVPVIDDMGLNVQLRALGSYIHPPVTKDITSQVTWVSNTPSMVTVTSGGLLTVTGQECGGALVSATVTTNTSSGNISSSGALVTGSMTANVVCFTGTGSLLTVNFVGGGAGTVTSFPSGLSCVTTCTGAFATGTSVTLTATANGSTFGGWSGCDTQSGQTCILNLTENRTVSVTFE
jgi:hypothetical protein